MIALALDNNPAQCLLKGQEEHDPLLVFMVPNGPTLTISLQQVISPSPAPCPGSRLPSCPVPMWASNDRMPFQDFLWTCKSGPNRVKPYVCLSLILGSFLSLILGKVIGLAGLEGQQPLSVSNLKCVFTVTFPNRLTFCRPLETQPQSHPTRSTTPPGKQVAGFGALGDHSQAASRYSGCPSSSQSKS